MSRERIAIICPGRGSYTKETLGYLKPHRSKPAPQTQTAIGPGNRPGGESVSLDDFLRDIDSRRAGLGEPTISDLDNAATFQPALHTRGEHASPLIYACSYADFQSIDRDRYEIVAVTGNSMGWYLTLAFAGALDWASAFQVINTMGSMMKSKIIGGQIIYPIVDGDWKTNPELQDIVNQCLVAARAAGGEVHMSIYLGGYVVIGGDQSGLSYMLKHLPKIENYPFQLVNHAAFHTPMLQETSQKAFEMLGVDLFQRPQLPMVDGRGKIWQPYSTDVGDLWRYTFEDQVVAPYDFTKAITVTLKEFAPQKLVLLGPGNSLGGSIGQILIQNRWRVNAQSKEIASKADFQAQQKENPFLISMGIPEQRKILAT